MTTEPASSTGLHQAKGSLLNPFAMSDEQILDLVYFTHDYTVDLEACDVESLFNVVSAIMRLSTLAADSALLEITTVTEFTEDKAPPITFEPPIRILKKIAYQMINTPQDEYHVHQTTMLILEQLKSYTWDAKAVIALAAFSLEYGSFWHLAQAPMADQLGRSLAALNRVRLIERNRLAIPHYNILVKSIFHTVECITELESFPAKGYNTDNVPALEEAFIDIPIIVYWAIATIVACATHIDFLLGDSEGKYALSNFTNRHYSIVSKLKAHLTRIKHAIGELEIKTVNPNSQDFGGYGGSNYYYTD